MFCSNTTVVATLVRRTSQSHHKFALVVKEDKLAFDFSKGQSDATKPVPSINNSHRCIHDQLLDLGGFAKACMTLSKNRFVVKNSCTPFGVAFLCKIDS
jgi:hypothetical protein